MFTYGLALGLLLLTTRATLFLTGTCITYFFSTLMLCFLAIYPLPTGVAVFGSYVAFLFITTTSALFPVYTCVSLLFVKFLSEVSYWPLQYWIWPDLFRMVVVLVTFAFLTQPDNFVRLICKVLNLCINVLNMGITFSNENGLSQLLKRPSLIKMHLLNFVVDILNAGIATLNKCNLWV